MDRILGHLGGIGLGAVLMYFLDPRFGRRRRALVRDQFVGLSHELIDFAEVARRDAANRARGLWAEAKSAVSGKTPDDRSLAERIRSNFGRCVSHPGALAVAVDDGQATLSGPVLAHEVDDLISCVRNVPGVRGVASRLVVHQEAGNIPSLQGGVARRGARSEFFQENWSPTLRTLAGTAGVGLMGICLARRDPVSCLLGTVGFGLFLRATINTSVSKLVGRAVPALAAEGKMGPLAVIAAGPVL